MTSLGNSGCLHGVPEPGKRHDFFGDPAETYPSSCLDFGGDQKHRWRSLTRWRKGVFKPLVKISLRRARAPREHVSIKRPATFCCYLFRLVFLGIMRNPGKMKATLIWGFPK